MFSQLDTLTKDGRAKNIENQVKLEESNITFDVIEIENDSLKSLTQEQIDSQQASQERLANIQSEINQQYILSGIEILKFILLFYVYYASTKN